jgi:hypothetical protein
MRIKENAVRGTSVERLGDTRARITLEKQDWKSRTSPHLNGLRTAATFAGMVAATLLVIAALAGLTFATLRYVSDRSYRTLWEIENAEPHIAPR